MEKSYIVNETFANIRCQALTFKAILLYRCNNQLKIEKVGLRNIITYSSTTSFVKLKRYL